MVVGAVVLALGILGILWKKQYRRAFFQEHRRKIKAPVALMGIAAYGYDLFRRRSPETEEEKATTRALLIHPLEDYLAKVSRVAYCYLFWLFAGGLCLISGLQGTGNGVLEVERPSFGQQTEIDLVVDGASEGEIHLSIDGQEPDKAGIMAYFDGLFEEMKGSWLGDNQSFSEIRKPLELSEEGPEGIRFSFFSSNREVISDYGYPVADRLTSEGVEVTLSVTMQYKSIEKTYSIVCRVYPVDEEKMSFLDRLQAYLEALDEDSRTEGTFVLPESFEEEAISFSGSADSPYLLPGLIVFVGVLLLFLLREERKQAMEKRKDELERGFVVLLSKMSTLIDAGMSTKGAWVRIAQDYQARLKSAGKREYVYEEMLLTAHEMNAGIAEADAYTAFGRRCGLRLYVKFGNLLAQNLRQGISGLNQALKGEMQEALEERKNRGIRKGEQAETKQLFPMLLMLMVVIVILLVPAFVAF